VRRHVSIPLAAAVAAALVATGCEVETGEEAEETIEEIEEE
jgi:hypothetical protein